MRNAVVPWDKVPPHVIVICSAKDSVGTEATEEAESEQDDPAWAELQGEMDSPTNFQEFFSGDNKASTFTGGNGKRASQDTPAEEDTEKKMQRGKKTRSQSLSEHVRRRRRDVQCSQSILIPCGKTPLLPKMQN